jgi:phage terminase large subunit-like protein
MGRRGDRAFARIVAEVNFGGGLVEALLRAVDPNIPFKPVHASRGKIARAEPVSAL